jgi:4-amino-4-deoxy-L-arabinose transferase-like glycosyltransferase
MEETKEYPDLSPRAAALITAGIFLAGLALRLAYWFEFRGSDISVLLGSETMDSFIYHAWAERIAGGDFLLGDGLFTLSPFYSYLLAPIYALLGCDMFTAILVQLLLGATGIVIMYKAGSMVFSRLAGVAAAGFTALYGQYLLTEGLLLSEAFLPFLTALFILSTAHALKKGKPALFVVPGLLLGALFSIRPQYFLVVLLLPLCGLISAVRTDLRLGQGRRRLKETAWILVFGAAGAALAVAPLAIRNYAASGKPVMLTIAGGVNFYIGNGPEATGTWTVPGGFRQTQQGMFEDFARAAGGQKAAEDAGGETFNQSHSRYWFSKGLESIGDDFGRWLRLMGKKAALFWSNFEVPVNFDFAFYRQHLTAARLAFIPFFVIGSLGLLGMIMALRRKTGLWLAAAALGYFAGTILFFISARYRVAVVPYVILFAAYGVERTAVFIRKKEWGVLARWCPVLAAALVLTLWSWPARVRPEYTAGQYRSVGIHFAQEGDAARAESWIMKARELEPRNPYLWGDLGMIYFQSGRLDEAERCVKRALDGLPDNPAMLGLLREIRSQRERGRKE